MHKELVLKSFPEAEILQEFNTKTKKWQPVVVIREINFRCGSHLFDVWRLSYEKLQKLNFI